MPTPSQLLDMRGMFSQRDQRWASLLIGETNLTMGEWGCTITAVCRMFFDLFNVVVTPKTMEDMLDFDANGRIIWSSVAKAAEVFGHKLIFRGRVKNKWASLSLLRQFTTDKRKAILLELALHPRHWVKAESVWMSFFVTAFDPWIGRFAKKPGILVSGYAMFERG